MYKGPFWVIYYRECTDEHNVRSFIRAEPVDANAEITPSHKECWTRAGGDKPHMWNYFPRGRVEIRHGKALVFANPLCFGCDDFAGQIRRVFSLPNNLPLVLKADNSAHYACDVNDMSLILGERLI